MEAEEYHEELRLRFEALVLPHLNAAYNLARWLLQNDHDAEDSVQEAYLKAFRAFPRFRGSDGRAWLLVIVRNTCYSAMSRSARRPVHHDKDLHAIIDHSPSPQRRAESASDQALLYEILRALPEEFREVIVLHELENLSYKEITAVLKIPIGTVMSRLSRARQRLHDEFHKRLNPSLLP